MMRGGSARLAGIVVLLGSFAMCGAAAGTAPASVEAGLPGGTGVAAGGPGTRPARPREGPLQRGRGRIWPGGGMGRPRPGGPGSLAGGAMSQAFSTNWSGYAVTGGTYRRVAARWVEPDGACAGGGSQYASFWVGLDGFESATVEQTGSEVDCSTGAAVYYAWYEMYPDNPVFFRNPVRPGDRFAASVAYRGEGRYTLVLADATRHWRRAVTSRLPGAANSSAEVIAEAPSSSLGGVLPLADFGTVRFARATVDGRAIGRRRPTRIVMVNQDGIPQDYVSALAGGAAFTVAWLRAAARGGRAVTVP